MRTSIDSRYERIEVADFITAICGRRIWTFKCNEERLTHEDDKNDNEDQRATRHVEE